MLAADSADAELRVQPKAEVAGTHTSQLPGQCAAADLRCAAEEDIGGLGAEVCLEQIAPGQSSDDLEVQAAKETSPRGEAEGQHCSVPYGSQRKANMPN